MSGGCHVRVRSVVRRYPRSDGNDVVALDGVNLDVAAGTSVAVTGASGCGKSTLLALIGGLEVPTVGQVLLDDVELSALTDQARAALRRRTLGFVFQADNLQPFLTAVENVDQQAAISGTPAADRSRELLRTLGIASLTDRFPDQLSGGQRQRVAIARALVHRPALILADEPTGALDPVTSSRVVDLLRDAQRDLSATLVVVTHDPEVAARLDRTVRLSAGRVAERKAA